MSNTTESLQQHMSRFKSAYPKKKLTCLISLAEILKIVCTLPPDAPHRAKLAPFLTQACKAAGSFKEVKELAKQPLAYEQGKEKALLAALVPIIKTLHARSQQAQSGQAKSGQQAASAPKAKTKKAQKATKKQGPDIEQLRERKMAIDQAIREGRQYVEAKKITEAQQAFRVAMNLHVDEKALYLMIAEIFHSNEVYKESFEFLRQALLDNPNNRRACELVFTAAEKSNVRRGELLLQKILDKAGPSAHVYHGLAQFAFKAGRFEESQKHASLAFEADPGLYAARDLEEKAAKKLKK